MILQMSKVKLAPPVVSEPTPNVTSSEASLADLKSPLASVAPTSLTPTSSLATTAAAPIVLMNKPPTGQLNTTSATAILQMNNNEAGFKAPVLNGCPPHPTPVKVPPSPEGDNPWDLVPDQPKIKIHSRSNSKTDNYKAETNPAPTGNPADRWLASLTNKISVVEETPAKSWEETPKKVESWNTTNGHVEDPLEIEWAALANRNVVKGATEGN